MKKDVTSLFGMTTVLCLSVLPFSSYIGALPLIQNEWNLTNSEAGLLFSMSMIGYLLASLVLMPLKLNNHGFNDFIFSSSRRVSSSGIWFGLGTGTEVLYWSRVGWNLHARSETCSCSICWKDGWYRDGSVCCWVLFWDEYFLDPHRYVDTCAGMEVSLSLCCYELCFGDTGYFFCD